MKNQLIFIIENEPLNFTPLSDEHEVIVIVPSEKVLFLEAELPPLKNQQLRQALPFALEEQLIEDVTQLHFATGQFNKNQKIPVAIVAKKTLEEWLTILKKAKIFPKMIIPDIFVLPAKQEEWQLRIKQKMISIRHGIFNGFSCEAANLPSILQQSLIKQLHIHCLQGEEISFNLQSLNSIPTQLTHYSADDFLKFSHQCLEDFPFINLLQGEYKPIKKSTKKDKWRWLTSAVLLIVTASLLLFGKLISFIILNKELTHNEQAITKIYKTYFPNSVDVIAPRLRLEEKLKKISVNSQQSVLLYLLEILSAQLASDQSIQLNSFNFENNQLIITLTTNSFSDLDYFIKKCQNNHLHVKQQKAQSINSTVSASLLIQRGLL